MSRHTTPIDIDDSASQASRAPSTSSSTVIINPFAQMMAPMAPEPQPDTFVLKDSCHRPTPIYNDSYNPYRPTRDDLSADYSPYANREPLFDDRPVVVVNLPKGMVLSPAAKKLRVSWIWQLGYSLSLSGNTKKDRFWCCKLCKFMI